MSGYIRKTLLVLVAIGVSGSVSGEDSSQARVWLERMAAAMSHMTYQGTFVYVHDGIVETMRITHVANDEGERERIYSLSGPQREVIRDKWGVRCILEDSASVMEDPIVARSYFPELPLSAIESKNSGYLLETSGRARIAGHMAIRVSISPQDSYRYGYEFWLEEGTGLLLKWVLLDTNQQALAKLMFTEFKMGTSVNWDELESESRKDDFVEVKTFTPEETVISSSSPRWQPGKLPPGFRLESHSHLRGGNGVFEHSVYTDGLAAVSVYIEKYAGQAGIRPGVSHLGTNNAYAKRQGELQITVIGEVPAITVRSIANEMARAVASR